MERIRAGLQWLQKRPTWLRLGTAGFAALLGIAAGRSLLGRIYVVSGSSMNPTFQAGMWIHSLPIASPLERGDVVILNDGSDEEVIKRIVGMPGETVQLWHGYVFINHRILLEPYLPKQVYTFARERRSIFVLGPDQYFVLGDNRPFSSDSRMYGPVDNRQIKFRIGLPDGSPRARFGSMSLRPFGDTFVEFRADRNSVRN